MNERIWYNGDGENITSDCGGYAYLKSGEEEQQWYNDNITKSFSSTKIYQVSPNTYYILMPNGKTWYYEWIERKASEKPEVIELNGIDYVILPNQTAAVVGNEFETAGKPMTNSVVIADEINACPVVAIDVAAFINSEITQITLPETIIKIETAAFYNCA